MDIAGTRSNKLNWNMKTFLFVLAFTNSAWRPAYSQLPLTAGSDTGQPKRNVGKVSGDLLFFQNRGHVAMAAASGRTLGRSSISSLCEEALDCTEERRKPICGTDGRTYSSRCEITKAKCGGHLVDFKHKGKCPESGRCLAQRTQAIDQSRKYTSMGIFVPECKEDGTFNEVQCHETTGYCWCVDEKGKPIGRSSVRYKKPNCDQQGSRRLNRRRTSSKGPRQNKACGNSDRSTFNHKLIEIFRSEYTRNIPSTTAVPVPGLESDPLLDTEQKRVVQWKFTQLDLNADNILNKKEVRDLRRMVKKIVRPRACAKSFTKYCDLDQDKRITRGEWSTCLGVDINISFRLFMSLNSDEQLEEGGLLLHHDQQHRPRHRRPPSIDDSHQLSDDEQGDDKGGGFHLGGVPEISDESDDDDDADDVVHSMDSEDTTDSSQDPLGVPSAEHVDTASAEQPFHPSRRKVSSFGVSTDSLVRKNPLPIMDGGDEQSWSRPSMFDERVSDAGIDSKEEDFSDCFSARRSATEQHQQDPKGGHFIPNCTPDGGFQSAQCHTGYCWCVHEKSGKTIRGTATKAYKPDCEAAKRSAKTFKGCSLKKKQKFTEDYLEFLAQEMAEFYKNKSQSVTTDQVTKDQLARWKLSGLDSNKNQILDRKEWKAFRKDWKSFRKGNPRRTKLRKCWRNYLRYCDSNGDHRITMPEWLSCTNSNVVPPEVPRGQRPTLQGSPAIIRNNVTEKNNGKRRGPNPFDKILKSD